MTGTRSYACLDLEAEERQIALVQKQGIGDGVIVSVAELEAFIEITRAAGDLVDNEDRLEAQVSIASSWKARVEALERLKVAIHTHLKGK